MSYQIASAEIGNWYLELDSPNEGDRGPLYFSIDRGFFDLVVYIESIDSLDDMLTDLETSGNPDVDATAPERRHAGTSSSDFFLLRHDSDIWFLLLDYHNSRFRVSVPLKEKEDFVTAVRQIMSKAREEGW